MLRPAWILKFCSRSLKSSRRTYSYSKPFYDETAFSISTSKRVCQITVRDRFLPGFLSVIEESTDHFNVSYFHFVGDAWLPHSVIERNDVRSAVPITSKLWDQLRQMKWSFKRHANERLSGSRILNVFVQKRPGNSEMAEEPQTDMVDGLMLLM